LTLELMRWDAVSCGAEKMQIWADTGIYPFDKLQRDLFFTEKRNLWIPGNPNMNHRQLWEMIANENNIKI